MTKLNSLKNDLKMWLNKRAILKNSICLRITYGKGSEKRFSKNL